MILQYSISVFMMIIPAISSLLKICISNQLHHKIKPKYSIIHHHLNTSEIENKLHVTIIQYLLNKRMNVFMKRNNHIKIFSFLSEYRILNSEFRIRNWKRNSKKLTTNLTKITNTRIILKIQTLNDTNKKPLTILI